MGLMLLYKFHFVNMAYESLIQSDFNSYVRKDIFVHKRLGKIYQKVWTWISKICEGV